MDSVDFHPGMFVFNPQRPDWGRGQIQSVIGNRVTANFENAGKLLILIEKVPLRVIEELS